MVWQTVLVGLCVFLVLGHIFAVEAFDNINVDGDTSLVTVTRPLRILSESSVLAHSYHSRRKTHHQPRLLVSLDVEVIVKLFDAFFLQPFLVVGELTDRTADIELSGAEISSEAQSAQIRRSLVA